MDLQILCENIAAKGVNRVDKLKQKEEPYNLKDIAFSFKGFGHLADRGKIMNAAKALVSFLVLISVGAKYKKRE